jgi:hypothetical protein
MSKWSLVFDCPVCNGKFCLNTSFDTHEHKGIKFFVREVNLPDGMTTRSLMRVIGKESEELVFAVRAPTSGLRRAGL